MRLRVQSETPKSREDIEGEIKLGATVGLFRPGTGIVLWQCRLETERCYAVAALPYPFTAFSIPEPAIARSFEFMAGRTVSLALKARNHGSAMAGNSEESFMSKNMYPVRSPLSSEKYAASGFKSSTMFLIVVPNVVIPSHCCAFLPNMKAEVPREILSNDSKGTR